MSIHTLRNIWQLPNCYWN